MHHLRHPDALLRVKLLLLILHRRPPRPLRPPRSRRTQRILALLLPQTTRPWRQRLRTHHAQQPRREVIMLSQHMQDILLHVRHPQINPSRMQIPWPRVRNQSRNGISPKIKSTIRVVVAKVDNEVAAPRVPRLPIEQIKVPRIIKVTERSENIRIAKVLVVEWELFCRRCRPERRIHDSARNERERKSRLVKVSKEGVELSLTALSFAWPRVIQARLVPYSDTFANVHEAGVTRDLVVGRRSQPACANSRGADHFCLHK